MLLPDTTDLQATSPSIELGLDDVGVLGVVRGLIVAGCPTTATFDVAVGLGSDMRGAHMSRFHEAIDSALALIGDDGSDVPGLELLATVVASQAAELQGANRARASVRATLAWPRVAPASGRRTVDPFTTWATVTVDRAELRTEVTTGVEAVGMTACPCAQGLVREAALVRLRDAGLDDETIAAALEAMPIATHNQRSTGVLEITVPGDGAVGTLASPGTLADLVRGSMSARIHELLKRGDELAVVEAAHADPRFVEDCVRALVRDVLEHPELQTLPPQARIAVRQLNHESIHAHDVVAARTGTVAGLRAELGLEGAPEPA
ncbi:MAG: GTP cyclohydrolase I FolE2 [Thermoleophilia bacterium]|nr:GTP cyclohydrolase I FolE2 [Thermoleophilia bacterium]